jgi:hypothetical protein
MSFISQRIRYVANRTKVRIWQHVNTQETPIIDHVFLVAGNLLITGWAQTHHNVYIRLSNLRTVQVLVGRTIRTERLDVVNVAGPKAGFETLIPVGKYEKAIEDGLCVIEVYVNDQLGRITKCLDYRHDYEKIKGYISGEFHNGNILLDEAVDLLRPCLELENSRKGLLPNAVQVNYSFRNSKVKVDLLIVIPLYANTGLIEHQLLLFGQFQLQSPNYKIEIVYVIDDPRLLAEAKSKIVLLNEFVFGLPVSVISNEHNCGFAIACNNGFKSGKSTYTMFWNSDLYTTDQNALRGILDLLYSNQAIAAASPVLCNPDGVVQTSSLERRRHPEHQKYYILESSERGMPFSHFETNSQGAYMLTGGALVVKSSLFQKVGGFPTRYGQGDFEDAELTLQLSRHGVLKVVNTQFFHLLAGSFQRNVVETFCRALIFSDVWTKFQEKDTL